MKVILNSDVTNLGEEGDICTVAPGYARNFLLPKGLVMPYNEKNLARIEERRAEIEERRAQKRKDAAGIKERLEMEPLTISMTAGINGKLFGSVTSSTITEHLAALGVEVERKRIEIPEHSLKAVGTYKVKVKLYADQEAVLTVKVEAANAKELKEKRSRLGGTKAVAVEAEAEEAAAEEAAAEEAAAEEAAAEEAAVEEAAAEEAAVEEAPAEEAATEEAATEEAAADASGDPEVIAMQQAAAEEADQAAADADGDKTDDADEQVEADADQRGSE